MELFNEFGIDIGYVVIGMAVAIIVLFVLLIITMIKDNDTRKKYNAFMTGEDGKNLEKAILEKFSIIDELSSEFSEIDKNIEQLNGQFKAAYQKISIIKYDAFKEIGGNLSFVLVLLTAEDNGFILNSMQSSNEGCYTYTKEVVHGETFIPLSEEEQQALDEAKANMGLKKVYVE